MANNKPRPRSARLALTSFGQVGFTLLEIIIVVVIIGIAISLVTANLFVDSKERLRQETEQLMSVLESARDEAVFSGQPVAVHIVNNEVEFLDRDSRAIQTVWQPSSRAGLQKRPLARGVQGEIAVSGVPTNEDPIIVFQAAGVSAPFEFRLYNGVDGAEGRRVIYGDPLGNLSLIPYGHPYAK